MTMDRIDLAKLAVGYITAAGTGRIVKSIIENNVATPEKLRHKVEIAGAAIVIGMMAKDATKQYVDTKIDTYVTKYNETVKPKLQKLAEDQAS